MFNKILVATDSPTIVDGPTFTAVELALQHASELYILHVLESSYSGKFRQFVKHFESGEEVVADKAYEKQVEKDMEGTIADLVAPLKKHQLKVTAGLPWEQILKWAREKKTDLIVLGAHTKRAEHEGLARVTGKMGSTVEEVILRERCPVMIVNEPATQKQLRFERILVPMDFSESCEYALQFASSVAQKNGGHLLIFHMAHVPPLQKLPAAKANMMTSTLKNLAKKIPRDVPREYTVRAGTLPYLEILKYAAEQGVDLIVMGSHTRKEADRPYLGSAVVQVSCQSLRPVIVANASKVISATREEPGRTQIQPAQTYQPMETA